MAFSGANGGGTHKGVSGTSIKVAFRVLNERGFQQTLADLAGASLVDSPATVKRTVQTMADYFNKRFQFYGRKIQIVFYDGQGSNTNELLGKGRDKAEADAIKVAEEIGAFADLSATSEPYAGALAKREASSASARRTSPGRGTSSGPRSPGASPPTARSCPSWPPSTR